MAGLNPVLFTERVLQDFLRYQVTTHRFADPDLQRQLEALLNLAHARQSPLIKGPYVSLARAFRPGPPMSDLVGEGVLHPHIPNLFTMPSLYGHQERACRSIHAGQSTIVSTGTGSGKTESFLLPIISKCLQLRDEGAAPGIRAVILYPMNALAEDQLTRLRELLCGTGIPFALYVGKTPERRADVRGIRLQPGSSRADYQARAEQMLRNRESIALHPPEERVSREELRTPGQQPRILLTNAKMLELLLTRATDVELFNGADLDFIVTDEAHTFKGAQGAEVACLLRRMRSFAGSERTISVATSATLSSAEQDGDAVARRFASRFFGIDGDAVEVIREEYVESEWDTNRRPDIPLDSGSAQYALNSVLNTLDLPDDQIGGALSAAYRTLASRPIDSRDWEASLYTELSASETVYQLAHVLTKATALESLLAEMSEKLGRPFSEEEAFLWMALGAAAKREGRPLLRPVLHAFIRGIDGAVVTFPEADDKPRLWLSAQDAAEETQAVRLPILSCTTCGNQYYEHFVAGFTHDRSGIGGGELHQEGTCWKPLGPEAEGVRLVLTSPGQEDDEHVSRMPSVFLCRECGCLHDHPLDRCLGCGVETRMVELGVASQEGKLKNCGACQAGGRDAFGTGYREPAKPVRASAVAEVHVLAQNMLHHGVRKRLLIFTDNRQDAAFQAGWMRDHARRYRLRAIIQGFLHDGPTAPGDLISRLIELFESDDDLSEALLPEVWEHAHKRREPDGHVKWRRFHLHALLMRELTVGQRQGIGLEPWGRMRVRYHGLDAHHEFIQDWSAKLEVAPEQLVEAISTLLDAQRRTRLLLDRLTQIWSRWHRDGDTAVQQGYVPESRFTPKVARLRKQGEESGHWISERGATGVMDAVAKWGVPQDDRIAFIEGLWQLLCDSNILIDIVTGQGKQIDLDVLRLEETRELYRCQTCRRTYTRHPLHGACIGWRCKGQVVREAENPNNYDLLTIDNQFEMVRPREHSAQVPEKEREALEIQFKKESDRKLNTLVATPTLELGVDIGAIDAVLLRNVPPLPSNYWQRAGRAGRRHRMAVTLTYARGVSHDRAYFRDPLKMLAGIVTPPRFHLGNPVMVAKHVRSIALAHLYRLSRSEGPQAHLLGEVLRECLPAHVKSWVFEADGKVRDSALSVAPLTAFLDREANQIIESAMAAFALGWPEQDADVVSLSEITNTVSSFVNDLQQVVNRVFNRVRWALDQKANLAQKAQTYGTLSPDERLLDRRCDKFIRRIKGEENRERAEAEGIDDTFAFAVLAAEGLLPGYGLDSGNVQAVAMRDGNVPDFKLGRPSAMGVREFVPGNLIYANNRRLVTSVIHRVGSQEGEDLRSYVVDVDHEAIVEVAGLGTAQVVAMPVSDVDLSPRSRITDDEEFRFAMPVAVFAREERRHRGGQAYRWGEINLDFRKGLELSLVNVGEAKRARKGELGFWICRVCGQCKSPYANENDVNEFMTHHRERCGRDITPTGFYAKSFVDALSFKSCPSREYGFSLVEAIRQGACAVLEMEPEDLQIVSLGSPESDSVDILLYDAMVGGSGLLQELIGRWPEVIAAARALVEDCPGSCEVACIDCLMSYRNQFLHRHLNRHSAQEALAELPDSLEATHEIPAIVPIHVPVGGGEEPANHAERRLLTMMRRAGFPEPAIHYRIDLPAPLGWTEPDFHYVLQNGSYDGIAVYLDGMSGRLHGNPETATRDRQIRATLEERMDYLVITIPFGHLNDPGAMTGHFRKIARALMGKEQAERVANEPTAWFRVGDVDDGP